MEHQSRDIISASSPPKIKPLATPSGLYKAIKTEEDVKLFSDSSTKREITSWCDRISSQCRGQSTDEILGKPIPGTVIHGIMKVLDKINELLLEHKNASFSDPSSTVAAAGPCDLGGNRWRSNTDSNNHPLFGDSRFRPFIKALSESIVEAVDRFLNQETSEIRQLVSGYLSISFGDLSRIDYGTGHELNFACALLCLEHSSERELIRDNLDIVAIQIFRYYTRTVQTMIKLFRVQPAGSKGFWGLDDYFHLPFIYGSAQLIGSQISTDVVNNMRLVKQNIGRSVYLEMIEYIMNSKLGHSLDENGRVLYDISGVPNWDKINSGMIIMYCKTVLAKQPVMQHFHFSRLLPWVRPLAETGT
eukprot:GHVH01000124.1.p1 GENE.GHVH01000124.1~~GHVH01000124.1.p1  ORF type:complete len:360 (+),score=39.80 GHVH01000124.1:34-1113(+)